MRSPSFLRVTALFLLLLAGASPLARPAVAAEPEFDGACAMGLAEGKRIKTDCSINWRASDGKLYCFGNEDSKATFLKDPQANIEKARAAFALGEGSSGTDDMGKYSADDVKAYLEAEIDAAVAKNGGLYPVDDAMLGQTLALKFVGIDFVRTLHGYGFFPTSSSPTRTTPRRSTRSTSG